MILKYLVSVLLLLISLILVFYSTGKLMLFLTVPYKQLTTTRNGSVFWSLFINSFLLSIFMLQHTLMALPAYKQFLNKIGLNVASRCIYNLTTSLALLVLTKYWSVTSGLVFWEIDINNKLFYYLFYGTHIFCWVVIYAGCLLMDLTEILGMKQVYYSICKMPNPMDFKSVDLQKLYKHIRHPSFTAFSIILWANPFMSLDRYLLSSVLTAYMYFAWNTDDHDYNYQKYQYIRKSHELSHLKQIN